MKKLNQKKSLILKVAGGMAFALVFALNMMLFVKADGTSLSAKTSIAAAYVTEPPTGTCKWKLTDCPGLGTGDYEACLTNGNGNTCNCGDVSRECPKP